MKKMCPVFLYTLLPVDITQVAITKTHKLVKWMTWDGLCFHFNTAAFFFFFANISVCLIPHSNVWLLCGLSIGQKRLRNPASSVSYYSYTIVHNKCVCLYSCTKLRATDNPGLEPDYDSRITL